MALTFNPITKKVSVGGREFILSALPVGLVRTKILPISQGLAAGSINTVDAIGDITDLVRVSLSFADPSITTADVENGLLMGDIMDLFAEVAQLSGMSRKDAAGEAESPRSSAGAISTGS